MTYMLFLSLLPTFGTAILGMLYFLVAFKLFLSFTVDYENDFGISNLGIVPSTIISALWFPLLVLLVGGILVFFIGAKIAMFKAGV